MRPFVVTIAVLMFVSTGRAGDDAKKKTLKQAPKIDIYFNPKEIDIDKPVPWKKASDSKKQKVRILGPKDMVVGTLMVVDPKAGIAEIKSEKHDARAELNPSEIRIVKLSDAAPAADSFAELAKLKGRRMMVVTTPNKPTTFQELPAEERVREATGDVKGVIIAADDVQRSFDVRTSEGVVRVFVRKSLTLQKSLQSTPVPTTPGRALIDCEGYTALTENVLGASPLVIVRDKALGNS